MASPDPPIDIMYTAGDTTIEVSWTAPTNTGMDSSGNILPITGYTVTALPNSILATNAITATTSPETTNVTLTDLTNGTAYIISVTATNDFGISPPSGSCTIIQPMTITINIPIVESVITLPINYTGNQYTVVNWGDGSSGIFTTQPTHTYSRVGTFTITVTGTASTYGSSEGNPSAGCDLITGVTSWGGFNFTSLSGAFSGCVNLTIVPSSIPTRVTSTAGMFYNATKFNYNIGSWDTSAVTDMTAMFNGASSFNQPIGTWNTSAVTSMASMFDSAERFNQPIGTWNTSALNDASFMFFIAISFNQPIGSWNTSAILNADGMFQNACMFNQNLTTWNLSSVTDYNSQLMFIFTRMTPSNMPIVN